MAPSTQPIHPDILPRLDPEYVKFHNEHIADRIAPHTIPWDPAIRNGPVVPAGSQPVEVGELKNYSLTNVGMSVVWPKGDPPSEGWPVFIFFHGGGWTLGNQNTNISLCTRVCKGANCVVVSSTYRLAPEQPYPAAVEDTVECLEWVYQHGKSELGVDVKRIAVGGSSSGGNLAAVVALKAAMRNPPIPLVFQLLIVPVTDNTASVSGEPYRSWLENQNTPWLSTGRMLWFRNNYLPNDEDRDKFDASPIFAPDSVLAKAPTTWIGVTELDILRDEGIAYGEKLRSLGVAVEIKMYERVPHPIMAMDGVLTVGKELVADVVATIGRAFGTI